LQGLKKTLAYFLLIIFLFNTMGYYFIFEIMKSHIRKEMQTRANLGSTSLTIIKISDLKNNNEFQRVEKKEIKYKGLLYDVIKEVQTGEGAIFYCIHDNKEENLLMAMKTVNGNKFLVSLWDHLIKIAIPLSDFPMTNTLFSKMIFPRISVSLRSVFLAKWGPPPENT
jgi:hypothetical protein